MAASDQRWTDWKWLLSPAGAWLRQAAATIDPGDVAAVTALRKTATPGQVAAALDLAIARRKAQRKFPGQASRLIADPVGVEQASSLLVAQHKARRLAAVDAPVLDLCSGIGGDTMALCDAAPGRVSAIDRDPLRAWMTSLNADCAVAAADVTTLPLAGTVCHIDPSRRDSGGRRRQGLAEMEPDADVIAAMLGRCRAAAVKLAPGREAAQWTLPDSVAAEWEWLSEYGSPVQAVLWSGELAEAHRRATLLPEGLTLHGNVPLPEVVPAPLGRYLHTVDAAVCNAGLLGVLAGDLQMASIHPDLDLLTSDAPNTSPWLRSFEVLDDLPWRLNKVKAWLKQRGGGIVEVKTRGRTVNTDQVQVQLRGRGDQHFTVFILRLNREIRAIIARRSERGSVIP